jgi:nicotinate dehydrogenase subunit B
LLNEIAADLGVDPIELRLQYLMEDKRGTEVVKTVAERARWQRRGAASAKTDGPSASGRGVAMTRRSGGYAAAIADVDVNRASGKVIVKRITLAHDCGLMINPDGVKNQVEGNIVQGVSRAVLEEVRFNADGVTTLDWATYPILKFAEVPEIDIALINRPDVAPLGAGELATVPVPAAIASAIFDAVGAKLREAPFTPNRVLAAMKNG